MKKGGYLIINHFRKKLFLNMETRNTAVLYPKYKTTSLQAGKSHDEKLFLVNKIGFKIALSKNCDTYGGIIKEEMLCGVQR